jgi:hypothetical protein
MLLWHREVWLIDHGAALYFHHRWGPDWRPAAEYRYEAADHVMLPVAGSVTEADRALRPLVTGEVLDEVLALVPDEWLAADPAFGSPAATRAAYRAFFDSRLDGARTWVPVLEEARAARV